MPSLNVVALISGGKDSLFCLAHCIANGHNIIALANLHPPLAETDDMDSFMYQTVGHGAIGMIAKALELPLYRQTITGSAKSTSRDYKIDRPDSVAPEDEVEDMLSLLRAVQEAHPEINAVSSGAILSDYQRTRVESVASRLGLVSLAYLWHFTHLPPYKESQLLHDMYLAGQDSRIIKVASGALDDRFLWTNVANPNSIARLQTATSRFGMVGDGSVLGEGGEYETFTIDGPPPLWKHRLEVADADRGVTDGEGGTFTVLIKEAKLVSKELVAPPHVQKATRQPPLLDDQFLLVQTKLYDSRANDALPREEACSEKALPYNLPLSPTIQFQKGATQIANLTAPGKDAATQARGIMDALVEMHKIDIDSVVHTTILLYDMQVFQAVNLIYGSYFKRPLPPSRVTIACNNALPEGVLVAMSFVMARTDSATAPRPGLHVQSWSYWAPANIGPYSQAKSIPQSISTDGHESPSTTYIAGQIPLVPSSMDVFNEAQAGSSLAIDQSLLSLQHLWRVAAVMNVHVWLGAVAFIGDMSVDSAKEYVHATTSVWRSIHAAKSNKDDAGDDDHEKDNDFDVWDQRYGRGFSPKTGEYDESTHRDTLRNGIIPPVFVAQVHALPRNAPVEWSSTGYSDEAAEFSCDTTIFPTGDVSVQHIVSSTATSGRQIKAGWASLRSEEALDTLLAGSELGKGMEEALVTVYTTVQLPREFVERLQPQIIPCRHVWDENMQEVAAVMSYTTDGT